MKKILVAAGGVIALNGIVVTVLSNFNLGVLLCDMLGLFLLLWGIFYEKIRKATSRGFLAGLRRSICFLIAAEICFATFLFVYGNCDTQTYDEDAVIVLGAAVHGDKISNTLRLRLDKAVEYHRKNPEALIIVSGGKGAQENVTEAVAMEKYLISRGVNKNKIIKEEKAASTTENMRFSKNLLELRFSKRYKAVIVTNDFHIYRSVHIAKKEGINPVRHIHSGLEFYNIFPCYLRESLAVFKLWIAG